VPPLDWKLIATLIPVLALMQAFCWLLARGLGLRLERRAMIGGMLLPFLVLAPWLSRERLLTTADILARHVPGAPAGEPEPHELMNDEVFQLLPWELEVRHALSDRRLPFWSDLLEGGSNLWANPQAGVLSPLQMVARVFPIQHHLLAALALKILVGFGGTWLLARRVGRTRASSLLAAGGFALGGGLMSWAIFPITATVAWVPWLAVGTIGLFRRPRRRGVAVTALITAFLLLSGHPETAAVGGLFAAASGLCLRRPAGFGRRLAAAALAAVLGLGLAAPHVLPFLRIVPESQRAHETLVEEMPDYYVDPRVPLTWFLPGYGQFVLAPANPHAYGRPYREPFRGPFNWAESEASYAGLVAFAGVLAALAAARDRRVWPFLGFAVAGLLLAAKVLPLAHLIYAVPVLRVPAYSRFLPVVSLALCVAGAFGLDRLVFRRRLRREWPAWAAVAAAGAVSLAVTADAWVLGLWIALAGALVLGRWRPRWGAVALAAVLLADLVPWSRSLLPSGRPDLFYPRTELLETLVRGTGEPALWRGTGGHYTLYASLLPVYGVAEVRVHNPLAPMRYLEVLTVGLGFRPTMRSYFSPVLNVDHPLLDFLGVRVVAATVAVPTPRTLELLDGGRFAPYFLYRNPDALPRWFLPAAVDVVEPGEIGPWIAGMRDPARVAVLRSEIGSWRPATRGPAPLRALSASPGRVVLEVPPGGETLLATSIPWSEGWSARADGRGLPTLTVNGAFLGARLPEAVSRVELRFLPPGFLAGCAAFAGSALAALALAVSRSSGPARPAGGPGSGGRDRRTAAPGP
jgi:Bacterial membrane protein YfhO